MRTTFTLTLSNPTNATLGDATATGTIIDDDDGSRQMGVVAAAVGYRDRRIR